jgi:hypothetical protein
MSARSSGEDYRSWPTECPGASLGWAPALPAYIRLGFKGLQGANTLAYYENPLITVAVKSFIGLAPGANRSARIFDTNAVKVNNILKLPLMSK